MSGIELLCFDLDDTLWPCKPVIMRAEQEAYAWLQRQAPRLCARYSLQEMRQQRLQWLAEHPEWEHDLTEVRLRSLKTLLRRFDYPASLAVQATAVFRHWRNQVQPYPDVIPVLRHLRQSFTLVALTNGNVQLEQTPLHDSFDLFLSAAAVGAAKPHPALFEAVRDWSGIAFSRMLHLGDDPLRDVQAARRAGLHVVWVVRDPAMIWPLIEAPKPQLVLADLWPLQRRPQLLEDLPG